MFNNIRGYFQSRRKSKLFRQWVEQNDLPPEDIPDELSPAKKRRPNYPSADGSDLSFEDISRENAYRSAIPQDVSGGLFLPFRYILLTGSVILLLVAIIAVLATALIMRSS